MSFIFGNKKGFDKWAKHYDSDAINNNWVAPGILLEETTKFISIDNKTQIVDVGCGTGISGDILKSTGTAILDGIDYSNLMLAKAKRKNIYRDLFCVDVSREDEVLDVKRKYDLIYSVGMLGDVAVMKKTLPNLMLLAKERSTLAFCGTPRYGLENIEFMAMILSRSGFGVVSYNQYFAYKLGNVRKNYVYCVAQRD